MEAWIPITIAAAFVQNIRFMLQKQLKDQLSTLGVTFVRFLYGAPLAALLVVVLLIMGTPLPELTPRFAVFAIAGGIAQILATALLIALFSLKNFAVGISFSKTETVMTGVLSALVLAEPVGPWGSVAIILSVMGVLLLSGLPSRGQFWTGIFGRATALGLASGALFSVASIGYRGASLGLGSGETLMRAAVTLAFVTLFQAAIMALWLVWRERGEIGRCLASWRRGGLVGITSALGSLGWFTAFTLQNAAYVKVLGQVELIFTVATSVFIFRERIARAEAWGMLLVVAGIILLVI